MPRVLTGITPSGTLHIGNYFGAMRPAIELQAAGDAFYFIADYHSMTSLTDAAERLAYTQGIALDWLACGLDPTKAVFWRQSDVPEVCELTWLLGSLTPMGLLERAHSYKDKTAKGISPNFGLFAYPVLMAADILLYDTHIVPVGKDQKQHLEMTRDIAIKFNQTYGDRGWNTNTDKKVETFKNHIRQYEDKLSFLSVPFEDVNIFGDRTMVYLDPPYGRIKNADGTIGKKQISEAGYNCYWKEEDDLNLYYYIKSIDNRKSSFMVSGVLEHDGNTCWMLDKLIKDGYNYKVLDFDYNKVSRKGKKETVEVIITNYDISK